MITGFLILSFTILIILALPATRDFLQNCEHYTSKLPQGRLDGLIELARHASLCEEEDENLSFVQGGDKAFISLSHGLSGVREWFYAMTVLMRLLQVHVMTNRVSLPAAGVVMRLAVLQSWFSVRTVPEALWCHLWSDLPHVNAHAAFCAHYALSLRVSTLCRLSDDTPECVFNGGLLL